MTMMRSVSHHMTAHTELFSVFKETDAWDFPGLVPTSEVAKLGCWHPSSPDWEPPTLPDIWLLPPDSSFKPTSFTLFRVILDILLVEGLRVEIPLSFPESFRLSAASWLMLRWSLPSWRLDRVSRWISSTRLSVDDEATLWRWPLIGGRECSLRWFRVGLPSWLRAITSWFSSCLIFFSWLCVWIWAESY